MKEGGMCKLKKKTCLGLGEMFLLGTERTHLEPARHNIFLVSRPWMPGGNGETV